MKSLTLCRWFESATFDCHNRQGAVFGYIILSDYLTEISIPKEHQKLGLFFSTLSVSKKGMKNIKHRPGTDSKKVSPK